MTKTTTKKSPRNWQNNYNKTLFKKKKHRFSKQSKCNTTKKRKNPNN